MEDAPTPAMARCFFGIIVDSVSHPNNSATARFFPVIPSSIPVIVSLSFSPLSPSPSPFLTSNSNSPFSHQNLKTNSKSSINNRRDTRDRVPSTASYGFRKPKVRFLHLFKLTLALKTPTPRLPTLLFSGRNVNIAIILNGLMIQWNKCVAM